LSGPHYSFDFKPEDVHEMDFSDGLRSRNLDGFGLWRRRECIKGAIVGGAAAHMAGHGKLGAAAGCVIGHHEANKPDPNNANAQAPSQK
jgi:hypothetical protein